MRAQASASSCLFLLLLVLKLTPSSPSSPSRLLFYMPLSSRSYKTVYRPLAHEMARRGHRVVMVTPYQDEALPANYSEIVVQTEDFTEELAKEVFAEGGKMTREGKNEHDDNLTMFSVLSTLRSHILSSHRAALMHPEMARLLDRATEEEQDDKKVFDAVVVPALFNEVGYFLSHRFKAPLILFMPAVVNQMLTVPMGYFDNPSFVVSSSYESDQFVTPSFVERLITFLVYNLHSPFKRFFSVADQESLIAELGMLRKGETVDLLALEREAQFGLYFSHFAFDAVRPTLPNTADVGLIHCRDPRPISDDALRRWLDSSGPGKVVFVSFGSWLSVEQLPPSAQRAILEAAKSMPGNRFVVKRKRDGGKEDTDPLWEEGQLPRNVMVREWLPQQDILGHAATGLFVTQGGMMSVQESLYHGVPVLVVPLFSDQHANAARAIRRGYGAAIQVEDLTADSLLSNLTSLLEEPSAAAAAAAEESALLRNSAPMSPLEVASFWTEYVARHGGAQRMQSPAKNLSFVKFFQVDVLLFLLAMAAFNLWIFWKTSVWWLRFLARRLAPNWEDRTAATEGNRPKSPDSPKSEAEVTKAKRRTCRTAVEKCE